MGCLVLNAAERGIAWDEVAGPLDAEVVQPFFGVRKVVRGLRSVQGNWRAGGWRLRRSGCSELSVALARAGGG